MLLPLKVVEVPAHVGGDDDSCCEDGMSMAVAFSIASTFDDNDSSATFTSTEFETEGFVFDSSSSSSGEATSTSIELDKDDDSSVLLNPLLRFLLFGTTFALSCSSVKWSR